LLYVYTVFLVFLASCKSM